MLKKTLIGFVVLLTAFVALNLAAAIFHDGEKKENAISCIVSIQKVGAALSQYFNKYDCGKFPSSLDILTAEKLLSAEELKCPSSRTGFKYAGPVSLDAPAFLPLVWCEQAHNLKENDGGLMFAKIMLTSGIGDAHCYSDEELKQTQKYFEIASISSAEEISKLAESLASEFDNKIKALIIWKLGTLRCSEFSELFAASVFAFSPEIQFESARALARLQDKRGAEPLVLALESNSYFKRRQAFLSLQILTKGETFGYSPLLPKNAQQKAFENWKNWLSTLGK